MLPDQKIRDIAELGLSLPESARLAGMARRNFRNRAEKLGYNIKPGTSGRPRLFKICSIRGCTERYYSNGRCFQHFNQWYYQQNGEKLKHKAAKRREASRSHISRDELDRLQRPENRRESLAYGPEKKIIHLECGWLGDDLNHHIPHCRVKPEDQNAYSERWGFDPSTPLVSLKHSDACSQVQGKIWASFKRRSNMARNRWGKGITPGFKNRKKSNREILEIVAANPGSSRLEIAVLAGMKSGTLYKRIKSLGDLRNPVYASRPQLDFVRLTSDPKLRRCIASLPKDFLGEQFIHECMNNLRRGALNSSQFASFILDLEAELREQPDWIAKITAEIEGRKPAQSAMQLGNRVLERAVRKMRELSRVHGSWVAPKKGRPPGRPRRDEIKKQCRDVRARMQRFIDARNALSRWTRKSEDRTTAAMKTAGFSDAEIEAGRNARSAKNAARWLVTNKTGLQYDTVVEYDQD